MYIGGVVLECSGISQPLLLLAPSLWHVYAVGNVNSCLGVDRQMICHENAICHDELESGVYCVCMDGYVGDGFTCTGTLILMHIYVPTVSYIQWKSVILIQSSQ